MHEKSLPLPPNCTHNAVHGRDGQDGAEKKMFVSLCQTCRKTDDALPFPGLGDAKLIFTLSLSQRSLRQEVRDRLERP